MVFSIALGGFLFLVLYCVALIAVTKMVKKVSRKELSIAEELFFQKKYLGSFILFLIFAVYSVFINEVLTLYGSGINGVSISWYVFFIICGIVFYCIFRNMLSYVSMDSLLDRVATTTTHAIDTGREDQIFTAVDTLIDGAWQSIADKRTRMCRYYLQQLVTATSLYVQATMKQQKAEEQNTLLEKTHSFVAYIAKRCEWLFHAAYERKLEPIAEEIISSFGKMSLHFAQYHPSLVRLPLIFMQQALQKNAGIEDEIHVRATATLSEVVKQLISISLEQNTSYKETIQLVLSHLRNSLQIATQPANPALLMQPFAEIGQMLADPQYAALPDRDDILTLLQQHLAALTAGSVTKH